MSVKLWKLGNANRRNSCLVAKIKGFKLVRGDRNPLTRKDGEQCSWVSLLHPLRAHPGPPFSGWQVLARAHCRWAMGVGVRNQRAVKSPQMLFELQWIIANDNQPFCFLPLQGLGKEAWRGGKRLKEGWIGQAEGWLHRHWMLKGLGPGRECCLVHKHRNGSLRLQGHCQLVKWLCPAVLYDRKGMHSACC